MKKTRLLWFSRHRMSRPQYCALVKSFGEELEVTQLSGDASNVHEFFEGMLPEVGGVEADVELLGPQLPLKELVRVYDEVAAVLPIGMQYQLLPHLPAGRLLIARNERIVKDGGKVAFIFQKWEAFTKIDIAVYDLSDDGKPIMQSMRVELERCLNSYHRMRTPDCKEWMLAGMFECNGNMYSYASCKTWEKGTGSFLEEVVTCRNVKKEGNLFNMSANHWFSIKEKNGVKTIHDIPKEKWDKIVYQSFRN